MTQVVHKISNNYEPPCTNWRIPLPSGGVKASPGIITSEDATTSSQELSGRKSGWAKYPHPPTKEEEEPPHYEQNALPRDRVETSRSSKLEGES